jgi:hypothetical protein
MASSFCLSRISPVPTGGNQVGDIIGVRFDIADQ